MKLKTRFFNFFRKIFLVPLAENWLVKKTQYLDISHPIARLPPNHYQYKKGSIRQVCRNGQRYHLDISDFVQWRTFWGIRDMGKERLFSLLHAGDVFLDVGANIGEICLHAAKRVGKTGKVWAFEPISINRENLKRNIALNPEIGDRIALFPFALGEKDQQEIAFIHPRKDNNGMIRVKTSKSQEETFQTALVRSLDSFLAEKILPKIDGIKIDVEGYELKVLRGGKAGIQKNKPWLFIEVDDTNLKAQGDSAKALVQFLAEMDYSMQDAASGKPLTSVDAFEQCHFDLLAFFEK